MPMKPGSFETFPSMSSKAWPYAAASMSGRVRILNRTISMSSPPPRQPGSGGRGCWEDPCPGVSIAPRPFVVETGPADRPGRIIIAEERTMTATYTFDVFSTLDGYGSYDEPGDWGGYWGKQGPELLEHRLALYSIENRMVFGANTMRANLEMLGPNTEGAVEPDPWVDRMRSMPATVVSSTLDGPLDWPDVTVVRGDGVEVVARLKEESEVPLRSHGSLSLNWALM